MLNVTQLQKDIKTVLNVENNENLMQSDPWGPYTRWDVFARVPMAPGDTASPIIGL